MHEEPAAAPAEEAKEEEEEGNMEDNPLNEDVIPSSIIFLQGIQFILFILIGNDSFLKERIKNLDESRLEALSKSNTHYNEEGMTRRLKTFREINETRTLSDFFTPRFIEKDLITVDTDQEEEELLFALQNFVERVNLHLPSI